MVKLLRLVVYGHILVAITSGFVKIQTIPAIFIGVVFVTAVLYLGDKLQKSWQLSEPEALKVMILTPSLNFSLMHVAFALTLGYLMPVWMYVIAEIVILGIMYCVWIVLAAQMLDLSSYYFAGVIVSNFASKTVHSCMPILYENHVYFLICSASSKWRVLDFGIDSEKSDFAAASFVLSDVSGSGDTVEAKLIYASKLNKVELKMCVKIPS